MKKLIVKYRPFKKTFIDFHHQFKKEKGDSKLEISQKREALENVLIPWTVEQNNHLIQSAGFSTKTCFLNGITSPALLL
ncbi:MAG: hypothetical protein CM1200mP16_15230 [Nitrospina sp.]|nr:MAG: hypothetical protein CM1200mP16_15230 [Nitrospina sp.]